MPVTGLKSITIRVKDADEAAKLYEKAFNVKATEPEIVKEAGIVVRYIKLPNVMLALVAPYPPNAPFSMLIQRDGEGLHLMTLSVKNIEQTMDEWKRVGIQFVDDPPRKTPKGGKITITKPYMGLKKTSMHGVTFELEE